MSDCEGCNTAAGQDVCPTHGDPRLYPDGNVPGPDFVKDNEALHLENAELATKVGEAEKRAEDAEKERDLAVKDANGYWRGVASRAIGRLEEAAKKVADAEKRAEEAEQDRDRIAEERNTYADRANDLVGKANNRMAEAQQKLVDVEKRAAVAEVQGMREGAKWCCLSGYDRKFPEVEEIRQKILQAADKLAEDAGGPLADVGKREKDLRRALGRISTAAFEDDGAAGPYLRKIARDALCGPDSASDDDAAARWPKCETCSQHHPATHAKIKELACAFEDLDEQDVIAMLQAIGTAKLPEPQKE